LCAKRRACSPPWPPWIVTTALICTTVMWVWGLCLGPTWSLLGPCALATWPSDPCSLQIWIAPRNDRPLPRGDDDLGM
jgi:hypothetical protein